MKIYAQNAKLPSLNLPAFGPNPTLGNILSKALQYAIVLGGLAMFVYLIWGGLNLLTSAGNPEGIREGTQKIIFAIIGFLIIFASYFIIQLVETILGFSIL